jgi:subtilisin-like proprotein convertase family protein
LHFLCNPSFLLKNMIRLLPTALLWALLLPRSVGANTPATCPAPSLLTLIAATDSTLTFTWADVGDAYELEIRPIGTPLNGTPSHLALSDPPYVVTGLVPGQQYRCAVRTSCATSGMGVSAWSSPRNATTDLNNALPCPLDLAVRDTSCNGGGQFFKIHVDDAPGLTLGTDVRLAGLRLMLEHPWRSDLRIWLNAPDGTRRQLVGGLNAGDQNLGDPTGNGGCGQFVELRDDPTLPPLSAAAERDNITGRWQTLSPLADFDNGQSPLGIWQLEICDSKSNHVGRLRLAELVFESVACPAPNSLTINTVSLTSAQVGWLPSGLVGDSVEVEYGPVGYLPGTSAATGRLHLPTGLGAALLTAGLQPLTAYDAYLRQRCGPNFWGGYSAATSFFTVCPATLVEDFDTLGTCPTGCTDPCPLPNLWQNAPGDDYEWKIRTGAGLTYPIAGPPSASGGAGNYLFFRNSCTPSGANGRRAILRTLCVEVSAPAGPPCHFAFDLYMNTKTGSMGTLALQASTNGGGTWTTVQTWSGNRGKRWRREFVNLAAYDGQVALFQFVATGTVGAYGDIALDNLTFFGSTAGGSPDFTFFRDADGDGFGNAAQPLIACSPVTPIGYVATSGDCNDAHPNIHPNAVEIKCNGVDENCNGMADDSFVATPMGTAPSAVCAGQSATYTATSSPTGQFFWWNAEQGGTLLGVGNSLILNNLNQNTTVWLLDSIAAAGGGCASARTPLTVAVNPNPELVADPSVGICLGENVDFAAWPLVDLTNTSGSITWHNASPPDATTQLVSLLVSPSVSATFLVKKISNAGCADTLSVAVTVWPRPSVSIAQGDSVALCKNRSLALSATTSGGTAPLAYAWSNGLNLNPISVVANAPGNGVATYTVTATDANGCSATDAINIKTLPSVTQTNVTAVQNVTLCGGTDGSISVDPVDGVAPFSLAWSGAASGVLAGLPATGGTIVGLPQGGYRITVTDASGAGCSMVLPSLVLNAPGLTVLPATLTQPLCAGQTGSISVTATGTNPTFAWSDGGSTLAARTNLPVGTYTVTVTDGACVQVLSDLVIQSPSALQVLQNQRVDVTCFGQNNGVAEAVALGGTPPYAFAWSDGSATTSLRTGLAPGNYTATATDANGCTVVGPTWQISSPTALVVSPVVVPLSCFEKNDGAIELGIAGGVAPYEVRWFDGQFLPQKNDLAAGNYAVTVTDANGCTQHLSVAVSQPAQLVLALASVIHPTCEGLASGSIGVTASGGTAPHQFLWANGLIFNQINNLAAGNYAVTATDAKGCTSSTEVDLTAPQLLSLSVDSLRHVRCFGNNDGYLALSVGGAVGGLTLLANGAPIASVQPQVVAGTYALLATDGRGCAIRDTVQVEQPAVLHLQLDQVTNASCAGDPTGSIDVTTLGGTQPFDFQWNTGAVTEDLPAVPSGVYDLVLYDANGCYASLSNVQVTEPEPITVVWTVQNIPCFGPTSGSIDLSVVTGQAPFSFAWSHGPTTEDVFDLLPGAYVVTVSDSAGCVRIVDRLSVVNQGQDFSIQIIDNQAVSCNSVDDGRLVAQVLNGTAPYQFSWSAPVGLHPNVPVPTDVATGLSGGQYSLTVTDAAGCFRALGPVLVEESSPLHVVANAVTDVVCKGSATGQVHPTVQGGVPNYDFLWSNGDTTLLLGQVPAGNYTLTVRDRRGCASVASVAVSEPAVGLGIVLDSLRQDDCAQEQGIIKTSATGGYPPYAFLWSNGLIVSDLDSLAVGQYTLTLTDGQGCRDSATWQITALAAPLELASFSVENVVCRNTLTGYIGVGISGGVAPLDYFWSNGGSESNIGYLAAGNYRLTVTDAAGCSRAFGPLTVTAPSTALSVAADVDSLASGTWSISLLPTGGWGGYSATWSDGATGLTRTGLVAPAWYDVTLTDAEGCSQILSIPIGTSESQEPTVTTLRAWPNPTAGQVRVQLDAARDLRYLQVQAWTAPGTRVEVPYEVAGESVLVDLAGLPVGVYYLVLRTERWSGVVRVLRGG